MYKALLCGDRQWRNEDVVREEIERLIDEHGVTKLLIIQGGAPGADTIAGKIAHDLNVHVAEVKALWKTRGRGAGPQRNAVMEWLEPDEVVAFHNNIDISKGTADMVSRATKAEIPCSVRTTTNGETLVAGAI